MPKQALSSPQVNRPVGWSSQAWMVSGSGRMIFVSGLTSRDSTGEVVHVGDAKAQTRQVLENLRLVLAEGGAKPEDVIKVTAYICNRADFLASHEVRRAFFANNPPASTTVVISGLVDERTLIEIEAVAFVPA
jgi:2-iminobutanoate/2-iminopropanoate deaminase